MNQTPEPLHQETYKGIGFKVTAVGVAIFDGMCPPCKDCRRRQWGSFVNDRERQVLDPAAPLQPKVEMMRTIIDRAKPYLA